jgi:membrane-associated PAP2 superfamily phosphatase
LLILVYALIGIAAATTAISLVGPNIDVFVAGLFYDPVTRRFVGEGNAYVAMLRDHGMVAIVTCLASIGLVLTKYLPWRLPSVPARAAFFLAVGLALGPGLLVNGILKPHWGRPRPVEITQFGGNLTFVDWWNPGGACDSNCSFMSGEAATAAWMFGPAMLLPAPWRGAALGAAALFTMTMSVLRMTVGFHFFTDVIFGVLSTLLILLALHALIYRRPMPLTGMHGPSTERGVGSSTSSVSQ